MLLPRKIKVARKTRALAFLGGKNRKVGADEWLARPSQIGTVSGEAGDLDDGLENQTTRGALVALRGRLGKLLLESSVVPLELRG